MSDILKFVEALRELFLKNDFMTLATVLVGMAIAASIPAYWYGRWRQKLKDPTSPTVPPKSPETGAGRPLEDCERDVAELKAKLENVGRLTRALDEDSEELWRFHRTVVPTELLDRIHASGMKVLVFSNLKGGVGKTTCAANLAAYFERLGHSVLLIDFDYQGSLSKTVLRAAERPEVVSLTDKLLAGRLTAANVIEPGHGLAPRLPNMSLLPAGYELNRQETRLLMRWLLQLDVEDPRYALARVLAAPEINKKFKVVIIDTPPRLTLASVNALCAGTHFVVPTILDGLSIENVGSFLQQTSDWFRKDLNPRIQLAGIIGTMTTSNVNLSNVELIARTTLAKMALEHWGAGPHVFEQFVPDTARFRADAGYDIAYLDERRPNETTRKVIEKLGEEVATRIKL